MAGAGLGRSAAWAWERVAARRRRFGAWVCARGARGVDAVALGGRGRARGAGSRTHAEPGARGWGLDSRGAVAELFPSVTGLSPLPVRASGRGRHDGPGPQPLRAAVGDFGRPFRLPWRADRRLPDSDQVRPAGGMGWGTLAGLGEEIVRVGHAKRVCVFWKSGSCGDAGVRCAR